MPRPLFHFDVHDDVRVGAYDHRVEKDESHAGKVMEKRVYERLKDKFPYSRFEIYDPSKKYDECESPPLARQQRTPGFLARMGSTHLQSISLRLAPGGCTDTVHGSETHGIGVNTALV